MSDYEPEARTILALAIHRAFSLRCAEKERLMDTLEDVAELEAISLDELSLRVGRPLSFTAWLPQHAGSEARRDMRILRSLGVRVVPVWSLEYPPLLRETYDPPFLLFVRGALPDCEQPAVSIVGTRKPDNAGLHAARGIAAEFSRKGYPVVSGLAAGIDAAAHRGAVDPRLAGAHRGSAATFAVLGSGIDTVYPAANRSLARTIVETGGGLLSEYPPGFPARRYHFPERNRIIAGMSRWVLLVQAPENSGALITAEYALDAGRELFVHAAGAGASDSCAGTRALVEDGAYVVSSAAGLVPQPGDDAPLSPPKPQHNRGNAHRSDVSSLLARRMDRELGLFETEPSYG